jgi:hypothetical protein
LALKQVEKDDTRLTKELINPQHFGRALVDEFITYLRVLERPTTRVSFFLLVCQGVEVSRNCINIGKNCDIGPQVDKTKPGNLFGMGLSFGGHLRGEDDFQRFDSLLMPTIEEVPTIEEEIDPEGIWRQWAAYGLGDAIHSRAPTINKRSSLSPSVHSRASTTNKRSSLSPSIHSTSTTNKRSPSVRSRASTTSKRGSLSLFKGNDGTERGSWNAFWPRSITKNRTDSTSSFDSDISGTSKTLTVSNKTHISSTISSTSTLTSSTSKTSQPRKLIRKTKEQPTKKETKSTAPQVVRTIQYFNFNFIYHFLLFHGIFLVIDIKPKRKKLVNERELLRQYQMRVPAKPHLKLLKKPKKPKKPKKARISSEVKKPKETKCKLTSLVPRENTNDRRGKRLREKEGELDIDETMILEITSP